MMEITARHWLIAILIAGLAHAALALALVHQSAALPAASSGVSIELGDGGASDAGSDGPGGADALQPVASPSGVTRAAEGAASVENDGGARRAKPIDGELIETLEPPAAILAKALPTPKQAPKQAPKPAPKPKPLLKPQLDTRPEPQLESRPTPRSEPKRQSQPAPARAEPARKTQPPRPRAGANETPGRAGAQASNDQGEAGGAADRGTDQGAGARAGGSGSGGSGKGGSGKSGSGTGTKGDDASASNYYGRLATWLARHKRYPIQARRLRQEGRVKVTFTIASDGRVTAKRIAQSSGHELLDREVQAMLDRASPLPRIPPSLGRSSLTITLPVAFNLR